jgi:hypothetical protein
VGGEEIGQLCKRLHVHNGFAESVGMLHKLITPTQMITTTDLFSGRTSPLASQLFVDDCNLPSTFLSVRVLQLFCSHAITQLYAVQQKFLKAQCLGGWNIRSLGNEKFAPVVRN